MPTQDGFEYKLPGDDDATFFQWSVSDGGKDLLLIDRFTGMPLHEFFDVIEDEFDLSRGPIMLAMIATSIRAKFPDWTPERITRTVQNLRLSDVEFINADKEDAQSRPPADATTQPKDETDVEPPNGSKSSVTPPVSSTSATSAVIPV